MSQHWDRGQALQLIDIIVIAIDAKTIVKQGAEYVPALKKNQGRLYEDVEHDFHQVLNEGHARIETRRRWVRKGNAAENLAALPALCRMTLNLLKVLSP